MLLLEGADILQDVQQWLAKINRVFYRVLRSKMMFILHQSIPQWGILKEEEIENNLIIRGGIYLQKLLLLCS